MRGVVTAALITVIIGGSFVLAGATTQLTGETERSRAEFLRGQQQILYSTMASQHSELLIEEEALLLEQNQVSGKEAEMLWLQNDKPVDIAYAKFAANTSSVQIIASEDMRVLFLQLVEEHTSQVDTLQRHLSARRSDDAYASDNEGRAEEYYIERFDRIGELEQQLFDAARIDMGVK